MAAIKVDGQGTFPNLPPPGDGIAGKAQMEWNLATAAAINGVGAGKDKYWGQVIRQASDWLKTVV